MYRDNYLQKIKLLSILDVGIWIKKKKDKEISNKIVIVSELVKKQHSIIVGDFIKAVKKNTSKIKILILTESEIKDLIIESDSKKFSNFLLIFCNNEFIQNFKNISIKKITFSSLFSLEKITNQIKINIWDEFLKFKDYE